MHIGTSIHPTLPWVHTIHDLDDAWGLPSSGNQVRELREAGRELGRELRSGPRVQSVRTLDLTTLIYPTKYAFAGACSIPAPFVKLSHRALLVQFYADGALKNLLFNPSNYPTSLAAPYFDRLASRFGERLTKMIPTTHPTPDQQLSRFGLRPEDIDLIAFDHFHVQDLRPIFGTRGTDGAPNEPLYPNAKLLAPRSEWDAWLDLHPMQRAWYVADGRRDLIEDQVVVTDGDLKLGDGCLLLRTPGHTAGNQTLFVHAERGVFGCSENGTCIDNWSPSASRIPGLSSVAQQQDLEVILNANTPELGAEQYASMILEKSVVDSLPEDPRFVQMFSSSEVTPSWMAPGIKPTHVLKERDSGQVLAAEASKVSRHHAAGA